MNENRTWETEMSDAFDRRVRDLHEAPISFEQVTTRARGIRRRRQAAVAGGILAVAAVLTPIAVVTAGEAGRTDGVPPAATPDQTVTDSSSPALPDPGPRPMIGSIQADDFVRGDGVVFDLPGSGYVRADQLGAEIVAYRRDDEGNGTIDVLTAPAGGGDDRARRVGPGGGRLRGLPRRARDRLQDARGRADDPLGRRRGVLRLRTSPRLPTPRPSPAARTATRRSTAAWSTSATGTSPRRRSP